MASWITLVDAPKLGMAEVSNFPKVLSLVSVYPCELRVLRDGLDPRILNCIKSSGVLPGNSTGGASGGSTSFG